MPLYPDIRPDWLKPENKSVLDSPAKKALRGLVGVFGGDSPTPDVSVAAPMTSVAAGPIEGLVKAMKGIGPALEKGKGFAEEFAQLSRNQGPLATPARPFVQQLEEFAAQPIRTPEGPPIPYGFGIPKRPRVQLPEGFTMKPQYASDVNPMIPPGGTKSVGLMKTSPTVEADRLAKGKFQYHQRRVDRSIPKADAPAVRGLEDIGTVATGAPRVNKPAPMTVREQRALEALGKPKTVAQYGPRSSKLDADKVREIREMAKKRDPRDIAKELGVAKDTVTDILRGRSWKHVK